MNFFDIFGMGAKLASGIQSLFTGDAEFAYKLRQFNKAADQQVAAATGAAASAGIETTGAGSIGTRTFLDTMRSELTTQARMMEWDHDQANVAKIFGMMGSMAGDAASGMYKTAQMEKWGSPDSDPGDQEGSLSWGKR